MVLVLTSRSGSGGSVLPVVTPQGYQLQLPLVDMSDALLTPGPRNTALRSVTNGAPAPAIIAWRAEVGDQGIYLSDYLLDPRTGGNVAAAIELALTENPTAATLFLPGGVLTLTRTIDNFDGSGGLRSNLAFVGVPGSTVFVRSGTFTPFFAFPTSTSNVTFKGVGFRVDNPTAFSLAIQAYMPSNWILDECAFMCTVTSNLNGATAALGLLGGTNIFVRDCYFLRSQCGFGGLGYGCRGVTFQGCVGEFVDDFFCSAVCGVPLAPGSHLDIENVSIVGNVLRGMLGSGGFFVGSDGNDAANNVRGVSIAYNVMQCTMEGVAGGSPRAYILFVAGVTTESISIIGNLIADVGGSTISQVGVQVSSLPATTTFRDVTIALNDVASLGSNGAQGISVQPLFIDGLLISDNICRANRGILVANCRSKTLLKGNRCQQTTASSLQLEATATNISAVLKDNDLSTSVVFENALRLTTGAFTASLRVENCDLDAAAGESFSYTPGPGSATVDWFDNVWTTGIGAAALAAIKNKRPAFVAPGATSWNGAAPLVLTLLPVGHRAGLYTIGINTIVRTPTASGGNITRNIAFNAPTFGATTSGSLAVTGAITGTGYNGGNNQNAGIFPTQIMSDGSAAVVLTLTMAAFTGGPPVVDVWASATLVGIIPP